MSKIYKYLFLILNFHLLLSSPSCIERVNHCGRCNSVTKLCIKCEKSIYVPDDLGGCKNAEICLIGENHCLQCNEEGKLCQKCEDGYFPDKNGGCSYTDNCEISYEGKCLKCTQDFILAGENFYFGEGLKICKSINSEDLKNCDRIDEEKGSCLSCKEGYYLNSGDKKCSKISNCYESSFGICKKCNLGYYLNKKDDKCEKENGVFINCKESVNNQTCDICQDDYYFDEEGKCVSINYCSVSDESGKCRKCKSGYYLSSNGDSCTINDNCNYGDKDLGICLSCEEKYFIDFKDGKCKSNQEDNDFKYCLIADGGCKQCFYGYYLSEDLKCVSTQNCAESDNGICILCSNNYHLLLDNKCNNVEHCIYSNSYNECTECEDGFYYAKNNKTCKIAEGDFENCKSGYDYKSCEKCKDDYYLNKNDSLCYSNKEIDNFYKCAETDFSGKQCAKCVENYYLGDKDNKCSLIKSCERSENENKCIECSEYFCLDIKTGKCEYNDEIEAEDKIFYYKCKKTNEEGNACEICIEGYELNENGLCIDNTHCIEKNQDGSCKKCQSDEQGIFCLNNIFGCVDLYYDNKCLECNDILDFNECTKCLDGYKLNENGLCSKEE